MDSVGAVYNLNGEYKWEVNMSSRVSKLLVYSTSLYSPEFSICINNKETFWRLTLLYKYSSGKFFKSRLGVCLSNLTSFDKDVICKFTGLFIFNGVKVSEVMGCSVLEADDPMGPFDYSWTNDELEIHQLKHFTIFCNIKIKNDQVNQISNQNILSHYESLFTNEKLSDVTVMAGERKFFLHRCILANRSSVFEKMFETDMVEKQKGIINIPDFGPEILNAFFKYLYTNKIENLSQTASDLLCVAEKYLVMELKSLCENSMCDNINIVNAIEYLKQAEMYNLETLKSHAVKYIARSMKGLDNFKTSDDDSRLESLSPKLLVEILKRMAIS